MSTWKNAIPKEIPAIIPRLASNAVVIREKQPYKRRIPPPTEFRITRVMILLI